MSFNVIESKSLLSCASSLHLIIPQAGGKVSADGIYRIYEVIFEREYYSKVSVSKKL